MAAKIVLITGANTGIGLETVKALLRSDRLYHIILTGRDIKKAEQAAKDVQEEIQSKSTIETVQIDVETDESINKALEVISSKHDKIDCLVNNAGAAFDGNILDGTMTAREAWNKAWNVNVTGSQVMTTIFLPLLLKSDDARLMFITSGLSSLHDTTDESNPRYKNPPAGLPKPFSGTAYASTKTGLNMMMTEWARVLKNDGVKVWSIAPGMLATNLGGKPELLKKMGAGDPSLGGTAILGVIEGKRDADSGKVIREYGPTPIQPW